MAGWSNQNIKNRTEQNMAKKIFLGLGNVAGYFSNIKHGFDALGLSSYHLNVDANIYDRRESDSQHFYIRLLRYLYNTRRSNLSKVIKILLAITYKMALAPFFIWALAKCDTFIFGANHTFYRLYDLPILRFFNKKIIFVYFGSDSRPPYMNGVEVLEDSSIESIIHKAKKLKRKIEYIEKYADYIINSPTSGQFHEKKYINWFAIGMPCLNGNKQAIKNHMVINKNQIVVLHAPSKPKVKGSAFISEMCSKYKEKYNIIYLSITGMPNSQVLENIEKCDIVIDELYSDSPLGGLGVEAAGFMKPTLLSGYYSKYFHRDNHKYPMPPSLYCLPENLEKEFVKICENEELRREKGKELFEFVSENWSSLAVAQKFSIIINDEVPDSWFFESSQNDYIEGYGVQKDIIYKLYKKIINEYGEQSLCLNHNPKMLKIIRESA